MIHHLSSQQSGKFVILASRNFNLMFGTVAAIFMKVVDAHISLSALLRDLTLT